MVTITRCPSNTGTVCCCHMPRTFVKWAPQVVQWIVLLLAGITLTFEKVHPVVLLEPYVLQIFLHKKLVAPALRSYTGFLLGRWYSWQFSSSFPTVGRVSLDLEVSKLQWTGNHSSPTRSRAHGYHTGGVLGRCTGGLVIRTLVAFQCSFSLDVDLLLGWVDNLRVISTLKDRLYPEKNIFFSVLRTNRK